MKLKLSTMNAIVRITSKKQNKVRKLNAGQSREQIKIILEAINELPDSRFDEIIDFLIEKRKGVK